VLRDIILGTLYLQYFSALRSFRYSGAMDVPVTTALAIVLFAVRRKGFNKCALWGAVVLTRRSTRLESLDILKTMTEKNS